MAFIAGIGIYFAVIKNSIVAFIGLLLIISLVPPICNAGLFLGISMYKTINKSVNDTNDNINTYLDNAKQSIKLFFINIGGIFLGFCSLVILHSFL